MRECDYDTSDQFHLNEMDPHDEFCEVTLSHDLLMVRVVQIFPGNLGGWKFPPPCDIVTSPGKIQEVRTS